MVMKHQELIDKYDITQTGDVTAQDVEIMSEILERELADQRNHAQRKMAWVAMISMVGITLVVLTPALGEPPAIARDILPIFYMAQAGIVGAYMGFTTWMNR